VRPALNLLVAVVILATLDKSAAQDKPGTELPTFDYEVARTHETAPHQRSFRLKRVGSGFNQLRLKLTVSQSGDVLEAEAGGDPESLKFWPQIQSEIRAWKYKPFEINGTSVKAEIEEYVDLVPPERLPTKHSRAPEVRPNSKISIRLDRTGCYGTCPAYGVTLSNAGILFEGHGYVVASGTHSDELDNAQLRALAKRFVSADFYSMDDSYRASVTDCPTYRLSISIDGRTKEVEDYVGEWEGMPAVISELENAVDEAAKTERWIRGGEGLVQSLRGDRFVFASYEAQVMLREAAGRGSAQTVRDFLAAGVPLEKLPAPKPQEPDTGSPIQSAGWLTSAARHGDVLRLLIAAGASKESQVDKDLALVGAARSGNLDGVKALIAYGADPNADLSRHDVSVSSGGMTLSAPGAGSVLIYAAESGKPDIVREILRYHPQLEARDEKGRTAMFAASEYRYNDRDGDRVECVRLLAEAGASVNAHDDEGNTPLHETFLTDVERELLRLGANVNARNDEGETPIFTTIDDNAMALFIEKGADLTIRNNDGKTVAEAAQEKGPLREAALAKAIQKFGPRQ